MRKRVKKHQKNRSKKIILIEESKEIDKVVKKSGVYIIDSITTWLLSVKDFKEVKKRLKKILSKEVETIFVLDDIAKGVIPNSKFARDFVDLNSKTAAFLAKRVDRVYEVKYGIKKRVK
jgi:adenosyl cobinamide kinase/adenosyl cobinamide phosphate guanylyltransferase